jgi:NAD-dependent dihydropyrimidine dehydrogenase PreA subunit
MAKNWYPIIDYSKCTGCLTCYNFCPHEVYDIGSDGKPIVVNPENCVEMCRGCQKICPSSAIIYNGEQRVGTSR